MIKKHMVIITCFVLISVIAYVIYDFNLANQESKKYGTILAIIRTDLKKGKSVEEIVDYLKKDAANLGIISITPPAISSIYERQGQQMVRVNKPYKEFNVRCKARSIFGWLSGGGSMRVIIDVNNKTADSVFAGM